MAPAVKSLQSGGRPIDLLYIHPEHRSVGKNDIIPMGVIGLMNSLSCDKLGVHLKEATASLVRKARIVAMDIHWYLSLYSAISAAGWIKKINPSVKIVTGGYTATVFSDTIVKNTDIDFVVKGDAEVPFKLLVEKLLDGENRPETPNLATREYSTPHSFYLTEDIYDSFDYINIDWFPSLKKQVAQYQKNRYPVTVYPFIPVFKGCIHNCEFCYGNPSIQMKLCKRGKVTRSAERVIKDLVFLSDNPDIRTAYMIMDFIEHPGGEYSDKIFSGNYDLNIYYEFFNYPPVSEIDKMLAAFNHCFLYFPLVVNHIGASNVAEFDKLRFILNYLKGKNCSVTLWTNPTLARSKSDYCAEALKLRKRFKVDLMNGSSELIPVPGLSDDSSQSDSEFSEYFAKSRGKTASGTLIRLFLPWVFRSSLLLLFSRKIYSYFFAASLGLIHFRHRLKSIIPLRPRRKDQ